MSELFSIYLFYTYINQIYYSSRFLGLEPQGLRLLSLSERHQGLFTASQNLKKPLKGKETGLAFPKKKVEV